MKVVVVIPAYNEAERIRHVISSLRVAGYHEVVVVNDGSVDETAQIAGAENVIVLSHTVNRGMGAALATGNEYALQIGADVVVHFDGDGQMSANDIAKMITPIIEGQVDITIGTRFKDASSRMPWSKRHLLLPTGRILNYLFTGIWLSDAHNGFRAMSRDAAKRIVINHDGMAHNSEITEQIRKLKLRFVEVPVTIIYHEYGQGIGGALRIIRDLLIGKLIK